MSYRLRGRHPDPDVTDDVVALDEALAQKATVVVCDHTDLDQFGRIGAIERY